jgi:hypothetical protein
MEKEKEIKLQSKPKSGDESDNEKFNKNLSAKILSNSQLQIHESFQNYLNNKNYNKNKNNLDNFLTKNSYDIILENNLQRSSSNFRNTFTSTYSKYKYNSNTFSKTKREKSKDETSLGKINFEKSLRNYDNKSDNNNISFNKSNTLINMNSGNKKVFNNYLKNNGELFDPYIHKENKIKFDKKIYNSKIKSRSGKEFFFNTLFFSLGRFILEDQSNLDNDKIYEMKRVKELYERLRNMEDNEKENFELANNEISGDKNYNSNYNSKSNYVFEDLEFKSEDIKKKKPIEEKNENYDNNENINNNNFEKYNENYNSKIYQFNYD